MKPAPSPTLRLIAVAILCFALVLTGCAAKEQKAGGASGGMGMGGGKGLDESVPMGTGAIAKPGSATIGAAKETSSGIMVESVKIPADGWLVARSLIATGYVSGAVKIPAGESKDVEIPLSMPDANNVRVELRVDRGTPGMLDFDPNRPERAADRVIVVNNKPVQRVVSLPHYGIETPSAEISLWVDPQKIKDGKLRVEQALVPKEGWVVVRAVENGRPARVIGLKHLIYEQFEFDVPIKEGENPDAVWVTLHADDGTRNVYEFAMRNPFYSLDKPLTLGGRTFAQVVKIQK